MRAYMHACMIACLHAYILICAIELYMHWLLERRFDPKGMLPYAGFEPMEVTVTPNRKRAQCQPTIVHT